MKQNLLHLILGITAGLLLVAGVTHLFVIRFKAGDIYPPYSTLREDPLGAKVLYESLSHCPDLSVERNYLPAEKLLPDTDTTLLFLGDTLPQNAQLRQFPSATIGMINSQLRKGARIVITIVPRNIKQPDKPKGKPEPEKQSAKSPKNETKTDKEDLRDALVSIHDWLGIEYMDRPFYGKATAMLNRSNCPGQDLPATITCHTSLCFTNLDATWKVIYSRNNAPVIIERSIGKGSIVLSTLTYFVSNEAMRDERQPALLTWLMGSSRKLIFDEQHHGITESPGVSSLIRKYRLHWFVTGLVLLAGLFIWRNSISLVPPHSPQGDDLTSTAKGKHSTAGLINLLRRNIPPSALIHTCVAEWKKGSKRHGNEADKQWIKIQELDRRESDVSSKRHRPVETYNEISRLLKQGEKHER